MAEAPSGGEGGEGFAGLDDVGRQHHPGVRPEASRLTGVEFTTVPRYEPDGSTEIMALSGAPAGLAPGMRAPRMPATAPSNGCGVRIAPPASPTDAGATGLRVEIRDDGAGGADPARGTGLTGLSDRVQAAGGTLTLQSAPGEGTTVRRCPATPRRIRASVSGQSRRDLVPSLGQGVAKPI